MSILQVEDILKRTLQDLRISEGERRALAQVLIETRSDDARRAAWRRRAYELAVEQCADSHSQKVLTWLIDVLALFDSVEPENRRPVRAEAHFAPGDDCPRTIANQIRAADHAIDVCVFTITDDRISDALEESHGRGVAIRIITDNEKAFDPGSDVRRLQNAGIATRIDRSSVHMHHKFAIFDGHKLLTGSYNWTRSAAEENMENFLITTDPRLVHAYAAAFEVLWARLATKKRDRP